MDFLHELRAFLRDPPRTPTRRGGLERYRRHLLTALEQREHAGASELEIATLLRDLGNTLEYYTTLLENQLASTGFSDDEIPGLVEQAISQRIGLEPDVSTVTRRLLLTRASAIAWSQPIRDIQPWQDASTYLRELRMISSQGTAMHITSLGRIFLDLSGKDAVRWLLHIEAAQSTGRTDPWRIDRATLQQLVQKPSAAWWVGDPEPPLNWISVGRLGAFGLVYDWFNDDQEEYGYDVEDSALPILRDVADDSDSPMAVLVNALLQDDLAQRVPVSISSPMLSSTAATMRQARLVVHEVRNALIPVKHALAELARQTRAAGLDAQTAAFHTAADRGVKRMLTFADEVLDMVRLADQADAAFEVASATREAVSIVDSETPGSASATRMDIHGALPAVRGGRERFILALINLLRNAHQNHPDEVAHVHIRASIHNGLLRIEIDDDGPGVPADKQQWIFTEGYSTRAGGSGHGLPLARSVIENDMHGTLTYDDRSSLGGARFVIMLPTHDGSTGS